VGDGDAALLAEGAFGPLEFLDDLLGAQHR
jgi:hypothetical protein